MGFPGGASSKEPTYQGRRPRFDPQIGKIPWWRKWQPLQYFCLENPMDRGAWLATVYTVAKIWTMAPHSSTLGWKIPWMEEPGRLQSMGSLRVGHD